MIAKGFTAFLVTAFLAAPGSAQTEKIRWRACQPFETRITCVVDGDTLWYRGTKIRILDIDAPEVEGRCPAERALAQQATDGLIDILNTGLIRIEYDGKDRYGRALARLWTQAGAVGPSLVSAGLAEPYGRHAPSAWCAQ